MTTVHIRQSTTVSLNRFVAALINFAPGRGEIFANGHGHWVRVNVRGDTRTDVTEGSSGHGGSGCDWSELNVVPAGTAEQPGHGRAAIAIWSPRCRDRALWAPGPNGGSVRRLTPVPADWRWAHLLPLTGRPMRHGRGDPGAAGSVAAFALPGGGGLTDHVSG